ncbi:uncharacterized protein LOC116170261 isoform X1 [Photinus pyralis]|uniref:Death-inducer obliterator 1 n=1 Tax=Photinus pyralis TaxID=7054 RepID=A0A1Y1KEZ3_PHOPY|nr:uncharacterized protein LOC116170261 isoform X1 [Photinus pyralis]
MSHSVVKVTETPVNNSLVLVIDKDGYVTPDKKTVEEYLSSRTGETELHIMQVNKSDGKMMDVTVDTLTYLSSHNEEGPSSIDEMDEIQRNLMSFRMDHDYTPYTYGEEAPTSKEMAEIDELAETLSILEGTTVLNDTIEEARPPIPPTKPAPATNKTESRSPKKLLTVIPQALSKRKIKQVEQPVVTKPVNKTKSKNVKQKPVEANIEDKDEEFDEEEESENDEKEEYSDEDLSYESEDIEDDANDSDFELEEMPKVKSAKKPPRVAARSRVASESALLNKKTPKTIKTLKPLLTRHSTETKLEPEVAKVPKPPEVVVDAKSPEKKQPPKKEKKTPKPIPDDFALFSTPDIIRRVGGKQEASNPQTPTTPSVPDSPKLANKPAKIFQGTLTKPSSERNSVDAKNKRLSADGKIMPLEQEYKLNPHKLTVNSDLSKRRDRRFSGDVRKSATLPNSNKPQHPNIANLEESLGITSNDAMDLEPIPSAEDIRAIIQNEDTKTFTTSLVIPEPSAQPADQSGMSLENAGLELDQSLLDNINSDLIPEDILYQVAQSLVGNAELQNVIDKSIVDGNLVLDADPVPSVNTLMTPMPTTTNHAQSSVETTSPTIKGTQVVRAGGRVVVIPPIERPTTRSRNKHKPEEVPIVKTPVRNMKGLDDEHVSGAELDSSSEGEKSDDDDPDKLWCICNQPHNNRFMICCDSCEEWYHGKCVNVTKAMGHMMESKGKEWICLYCKDSSLLRPAAAARRIRKASHTSSSDVSPEKKEKVTPVSSSTVNSSAIPGCLVCGKPSRINSIYCSDPCILKHAKVVEKVVVFERSSGTIYTGSSAPSTTNLDRWLQQHPGFEVVRSANANKPVTTKQVTHSKFKLKSQEGPNTSLASPSAVPRKINNVNVINVRPPPVKVAQPQPPTTPKQVQTFKVVSKQSPTPMRTKLIQPAPLLKSPPAATTPPVKPKPVQRPKTPTPIPVKEKPVPPKTPKIKQVEEQSPQSNKQENIRDNVKKTLFEQLTNRLNIADDIKLTKEELTKISNEIESQLYKCFGDTGQKYRNKYRSLIFNIKDTKNQTLWRRICEKSINAYQLVRLSSDDLASQELALWRERENKHQLEMITKSELEQLGRNRQYVFKTHKGEQVLEDNRPSDAVDKTEVVMGLGGEGGGENASDGKKDSKDRDRKRSRDRHRDRSKSGKDKDRRRDRKRERRSSSGDKSHHKRSKSKDSSRYSDKHVASSRDKDRYRSSHKSSRHKKDIQSATEKLDKKSKEILEQLVDNKIVPPLEDRLWKHVQQEDITTGFPSAPAESDSDHEPTSTVTIPTPPRVGDMEDPEFTPPLNSDDKIRDDSSEEFNTTRDTSDLLSSSIDDNVTMSPPLPRSKSDYVWKGTINMVDVAQISITAHEVSGDCMGLGEELPVCLDVVGRISPETVWDYIGKMKCSNSKAISLIRLNATNVEEKMPYLALYSYLSSRNRLGVVKSINKAVKDFYILPLASKKPLPQALLPLNGPGFEESRPAILLGIIVRDKRKRPLFISNPSTPLKKARIDTPAISLDRSYTPPPSSELSLKVPDSKADANDEDEPYTPEDSDPDTVPSTSEDNSKTSSNLNPSDLSNILTTSTKSTFLDAGLATQSFEPFSNKFDTIPGLDETAGLPAISEELQRKMEELDERIAMQKAEIHNMSQDIASSTTTGIGTTALASIALPQNLQQILDSIKGITPGSEADSPQIKSAPSSDLTIPLMLPKINARSQQSSPLVSSTTIPLNLPKTKKITMSPQKPVQRPTDEKGAGVLSSLSEEDLIRKAAEMLGETDSEPKSTVDSPSSYKPASVGVFGAGLYNATPSNYGPPPPLTPLPSKSAQLELDQPPIPGLD